jgi:hypothetical protein
MAYRMYLTTKRAVAFNPPTRRGLAAPQGPFDKTYMNALYDYGYKAGLAGYNGTRPCRIFE